jgi:hypothetical protein
MSVPRLTRVFHELQDVAAETPACLWQGDFVAVSPDRVGPFGGNISRLREMFGLIIRTAKRITPWMEKLNPNHSPP